jgi:hypothetical protein
MLSRVNLYGLHMPRHVGMASTRYGRSRKYSSSSCLIYQLWHGFWFPDSHVYVLQAFWFGLRRLLEAVTVGICPMPWALTYPPYGVMTAKQDSQ